MYYQLTKTQMAVQHDATVASQRGLLQQAAVGEKFLVVLDDLWAVAMGQQLNFVGPDEAPGCKVFATTRFAKLPPVRIHLHIAAKGSSVCLRSRWYVRNIRSTPFMQGTCAELNRIFVFVH